MGACPTVCPQLEGRSCVSALQGGSVFGRANTQGATKHAPHLTRLSAKRLEFSLLFWIAILANGQVNVRSEINPRVLKGLREDGIAIPFPLRVVHLKAPEATRSATATRG